MPKILILYHSTRGQILEMAGAVAEGARQAGATVHLARAPELAPEALAGESGPLLDQPHPLARVEDLPRYDAIVIGAGARFGRIAAPMGAFLDQAGGLCASGALVGKVGSAFTSSAGRDGGEETALMAIHANLLHFGMVCVGLPHPFPGRRAMEEIAGASPYGASTAAGGDGSRSPSANELDAARFQGRHVAGIAARLFPPGQAAEASEGFMLAD
ncbi:MAG TPA: NAD(P)H:quinone oxidoreductase [Allosphingosinicella sp.]|jgi:NAD(P)H dehydrogenase (quinone)